MGNKMKDKLFSTALIAKAAVIATLFTLLFGCAVDSYTGSITVYNKSDKDSNSVKVGSHNFGTVKQGQIKTIYFRIAEKEVLVEAEGFDPVSAKEGKINLVFNTVYSLELTKSYDKYLFNISGEPAGEESPGYMY